MNDKEEQERLRAELDALVDEMEVLERAAGEAAGETGATDTGVVPSTERCRKDGRCGESPPMVEEEEEKSKQV